MSTPALLLLEDGSTFYGKSIQRLPSALNNAFYTVGEVIFNTSMSGYQEIVSDPSYAKQIICLTYPHIGNTGINEQDLESNSSFVAGLIMRDMPLAPSSWRSKLSLYDYLEQQQIPAIAEIDTRRLTKLLRDKGAMRGCIYIGDIDEKLAQKQLDKFSGLENLDLVQEVSCKKSYSWQQGTWSLADADYSEMQNGKYQVVVYDFGVKFSNLRLLAARGCQITVVPATTTAAEVMALQPDGVFLSNGPGDPQPCAYAIENIRVLLAHKIPMFGVCLGYQLLALASGASTCKMKFGHHGANHPVQDLSSKRALISSQNHGFCVTDNNLPSCLKITHRSLFDNTLQGLARTDVPAFGFQGHPEAGPGPNDLAYLFDDFIELMKNHQ